MSSTECLLIPCYVHNQLFELQCALYQPYHNTETLFNCVTVGYTLVRRPISLGTLAIAEQCE